MSGETDVVGGGGAAQLLRLSPLKPLDDAGLGDLGKRCRVRTAR
jgi:hypothetical protein